MSGEPPVDPVVSRKSGHMFEKRTILTYILETGTCPITGQPLSAEDLLELKGE
jgi:pre-mRNA-processing factor 19